MVDVGTVVMAAIGLAGSLVSAIGSVSLDRRRGRREESSGRRDDDRLALEARDKLLDRLQLEVARLDGALGDTRDEREECLRMHRECLQQADRMASRIAHLEERLDLVEQRSGDSTPVPGDRS
jgi:chromosome segregation ATPase